ncbi:MAG: hypothetical protein ACLSHH_06110 [Clostridia bacterium]
MKNYKEEFRNKLSKIYSKELLESLFYEVYTKISYIGREKLYKNVRLIKLLSEI